MTDVAETMRLCLQADLRGAMKSRDKPTLDVLRDLISAIDNAGSVALDAPEVQALTNFEGRSQFVVTGVGKTEVMRQALGGEAIAALFKREAAERRDAADALERHGKHEQAEALRTGAMLIESYL